MPYYNLYCSNERAYRWHAVDDIKEPNNSILQSIIKQVKEDISGVLIYIQNRPLHDIVLGIEGITTEMITELMEKYTPRILGIQTIHCETCEHLQIDVIVNDQIKVREDLWRSYETDRFVRQFMRGR